MSTKFRLLSYTKSGFNGDYTLSDWLIDWLPLNNKPELEECSYAYSLQVGGILCLFIIQNYISEESYGC